MKQPSSSWILPLAAFLGLTGVALGAFGAHALRELLPTRTLEAFTTATRYQLLHAIALLALVGLPILQLRERAWVARLWGVGILLFSGSIYLMAATGWRWLGPVTPVGGGCLIGGWGVLLGLFLRKSA